MKTISLKAEKRNTTTQGEHNQLKKAGFVPGNVYGEGHNIQIKIDARHLKPVLYTPDTFVVHLDIEGNVYPCIIKEAQFHKVTDRPIHIDFQIINENNPITVTLPVVTKGQSEGVKAGGKLHISMRRVKVKGLVKDIPDALELDITNLGVGKTIVCGDVKLQGLTLLHPENLAIVGVHTTRNVVEEAAPAAATNNAPAQAAAKK